MSKKLNSISDIRTGYNFRSITNVKLQTVFLVSAKDLNTDFADVDEIYIPDSYGGYLQEGDILVKSRGASYEAKVFTPLHNDYPYIAASTLIIVRLRDNTYKPSYIAQIINSDGAQQFLRSLSFGQTVPILSPSSLGSLMCPKVSIEKQDQLEIVTETLGEYRIVLSRYVEAQEKLSKALQNEIMKGVK